MCYIVFTIIIIIMLIIIITTIWCIIQVKLNEHSDI